MTPAKIPAQQPGAGTQQEHAQNQGRTDIQLYEAAAAARAAGSHKLSHSQVWRYIRKFRAIQATMSADGSTDPFLAGLLTYADSTGNTATQKTTLDRQDPRIILGLPVNAKRDQIETAYTRKLRYIANVSRDASNLRRVHAAYKVLIGGVAA